MSIRLRIANPSDAPAVNAIFDHYIAHSLATFNEHTKPVEVRAKEIETLLKDYPYLIAEDENGRMLGFANAEPIRSQSGYRFCVELTIYLHPDAPKHAGIGTALYDTLLRILTQQGYCTAFGILYGGNHESLGLHKRFGFQEVALLHNTGYKQGKWLDTRIVQKQLNPCSPSPKEPIPFETYREGLVLP